MALKHPIIQIQGHIKQAQQAAFLALFFVSGERTMPFAGSSSGFGKGGIDIPGAEETLTEFVVVISSVSNTATPAPTQKNTPKKILNTTALPIIYSYIKRVLYICEK